MASKRIANTNGSQNSLLNTAKPDTPKMVVSGLDEKQKVFVKNILDNIFQSYVTRDDYINHIESISINATLGRIASLLDEVKNDFTSNELEQIKTNIVESVKLALEDKVRNNDVIDIQNLTNVIVQNISEIQQNKLDELKTSIASFITAAKNDQQQQLIDLNNEKLDVVKQHIQTTIQQNNDAMQQSIEELNSAKDETTSNDNQEQEAEKAEQLVNDMLVIINKFKKTFSQHETDINNRILDISNKIDNAIIKIDNAINNSTRLLPTSKDKKNKKKKAAIQENINKLILDTSDKLDKILSASSDIVAMAANLFSVILDKAKSILFKFFLKLVMTVIVPTFIIIGGAIYLLAEPLKKVLQPILDFVDGMITKAINFLKPVRDFMLDVLRRIFNIIKPALVAFFKGLQSEAKNVAIGLGEFVESVLNVLKSLMDGIATHASEVGKALVELATSVIDVLSEFMQGLSTQAEAIGQGLGKFVTTVLDTLRLFAEGIGTQAEAIGKAIGRVALGLVNVTHLLVQFCKECVGILVAIVGIIRDFFEGIRSKARAIGEMISQIMYHFFEGFNTKAEAIGEALAELVLKTTKLITKLLKGLQSLDRGIKLNVIAPFKALGRKINALRVAGEEKGKFTLFGCTINLFGFLTTGMSNEAKQQAYADQGKSVTDLVSEEQHKLEEQFKAEDEAAALKELNDKIMQKNLQQIIDNLPNIQKSVALIKDLHSHFLGQEKTDELINAIQAMKPQMDQLENIQQENADTRNAAETLKNEQEDIEDKDDNKQSDVTQNDIMSYLQNSFAKLINELNKPTVVPMQINTAADNMAAIEDQ